MKIYPGAFVRIVGFSKNLLNPRVGEEKAKDLLRIYKTSVVLYNLSKILMLYNSGKNRILYNYRKILILYNPKKGVLSLKFQNNKNSLSSEYFIYFEYIRRKYPWIPTDIIENIIKEEILDKEVKLYLFVLVSIFPDVNIEGKHKPEN